MNNPGEIVIAFFELVEAEFREIKNSLNESVNLKSGALGRLIMRLVGSVALVLAAIVLILAAVGMSLWIVPTVSPSDMYSGPIHSMSRRAR